MLYTTKNCHFKILEDSFGFIREPKILDKWLYIHDGPNKELKRVQFEKVMIVGYKLIYNNKVYYNVSNYSVEFKYKLSGKKLFVSLFTCSDCYDPNDKNERLNILNDVIGCYNSTRAYIQFISYNEFNNGE